MDESEQWKLHAACRGQSPAMFIPDASKDHRETQARHVEAVQFCQDRCSVTEECLAWALSTGEETLGVYGATTPRQRREIRERQLEEGRRVSLQQL